jgi:hypothetical protein
LEPSRLLKVTLVWDLEKERKSWVVTSVIGMRLAGTT